ncbi:tRNA (adenosine(37)-N6)-dimethylallyltransferase MiaA [Facklamia sp. DSM 111018]|uniref:tRNA dimethylallyltransferase n=1 Tax=Facklamia lactis TaxID=2749967 RepID=A0ABS0LR65_9LACT|nr:tRNA (adenosine(37)-N6)-dimethylallyltransferase MiaA [Facklamia lactis]MBG9986653.1 tRNA (adenosine(37)-N6)-dimethylallyltransferase MiaA [Facklamia lactis]
MPDEQISLVVLAGPTGVGKTDLSIHLARQFSGQIINADSMQIYKGLDIGTGKIKPEEMEEIPHHLLDICYPDQFYSASQFQKDAVNCIRQIAQEGDLPILVGGTGLYLEGLLYQLEFGGKGSFDPEIRENLEKKIRQKGNQFLWDKLATIDPKAANKIPVQNGRRIIRALEVIEQTGQNFSDQAEHNEQRSRFNELLFVLDRPREELYDRINRRVLGMIEAGLEEEARWLFDQKLDPQLSSIKGIGYKEWFSYFQGEEELETVIAKIQQNSRRYAKRQLTWFRNRMKQPCWLDVSQTNYLIKACHFVDQHIQ